MIGSAPLAVILLTGASPAPCVPARLSPGAAALLKPMLSEFLVAHAEEFDKQGRYRGTSPHEAVFEDRFYKLLATRGETATEAIAALMAFYVGEHPGEELLCEATKRGKLIEPYLRRFSDCPPKTGLEPIDPFFTNIPNQRQRALQLMRAGENPCAE